MGMAKEFKEFALRGNVVDLAVGVIIGAAFGKIVSSLVNDIVMPSLGYFIGGVDFGDLAYELKAATVNAAGEEIPAVLVKYGAFIQTVVDFVIIALAIFVAVKVINSLKRKEAASPEPPPAPTETEKLLAEIRDLLKTR